MSKHPTCPKCKKRLKWCYVQNQYVTDDKDYGETVYNDQTCYLEHYCSCGKLISKYIPEIELEWNEPSLENVDWYSEENSIKEEKLDFEKINKD